MATHIPTREEALVLLKEYNGDESLIKHALAVEGAMRYIARKHGEKGHNETDGIVDEKIEEDGAPGD